MTVKTSTDLSRPALPSPPTPNSQEPKNSVPANVLSNGPGATPSSDRFKVGTTSSKPVDIEGEPKLFGKGSVVYAETGAKLFTHPPALRDIDQGSIGDCFFLSSVASLAKQHPEQIQNNVRYVNTTQNAQGQNVNHYEVTLHKRDPQSPTGYSPVQVPVDDELPVDRKAYGKGTVTKEGATSDKVAKRELWVSLYEKAFAQFKGGYNVIDAGGIAGHAMEALTGLPAKGVPLMNQDPDKVFQTLSDAVSAGKLTTADTYDNGVKPNDGVRWALKHENNLPSSGGKPTYDPATFKYDDDDKTGQNGLVSGHEYTVVGTGISNGQKYVDLRNPWGDTEPKKWGDGKEDGTFRMPLADFLAVYQNAYVGNTGSDVWGLAK